MLVRVGSLGPAPAAVEACIAMPLIGEAIVRALSSMTGRAAERATAEEE